MREEVFPAGGTGEKIQEGRIFVFLYV